MKARTGNKPLMTNGDFIDANLFLNTNHQSSSNQDGPIITTPASPLDDTIKSHVNNGKSQLNYATTSPSNTMNVINQA